MPDHNSFLDAYFASHEAALKDQMQAQAQQQFQQKLAYEKATQQQDFGLRTQQFLEEQQQHQAENVFRQQQLTAAQQQHADALREQQQKAAEPLFNKPGASVQPVTSQNTQTTALPQVPAPEGLPQLPAEQQTVQTTNTLPAGSQVVPTSVIPGGTNSLPAGLELQQKTPAQLEAEKKQADTDAAKSLWRQLTPESYNIIPKTYDALGYKPGDKIDPKHDEAITKFLLNPDPSESAKGMDSWKAHYIAALKANNGQPLSDEQISKVDRIAADSKETSDTIMSRYFTQQLHDTQKAQGISGAAATIAAPESYNFSGDAKAFVDKELLNQGYAPPNLKDSALRSQDAAAKQTVGVINGDATGPGLRDMLKNDDVKANMGFFAGQSTDYMLKEVGSMPTAAVRVSPQTAANYRGNPAGLQQYKEEVKRQLGYLASQFNTLKLIKAKEQMPGRLIGSLVDQNGKLSPSLGKDPNIIEGQLDAMLDVSRQVQLSYRKSMGKGWDTEPNFVKSLPNTLEEVTKGGKQLTQADIDNSPFKNHPPYVPFTIGNKRYIMKERINSDGSKATEGGMTLFEYR